MDNTDLITGKTWRIRLQVRSGISRMRVGLRSVLKNLLPNVRRERRMLRMDFSQRLQNSRPVTVVDEVVHLSKISVSCGNCGGNRKFYFRCECLKLKTKTCSTQQRERLLLSYSDKGWQSGSFPFILRKMVGFSHRSSCHAFELFLSRRSFLFFFSCSPRSFACFSLFFFYFRRKLSPWEDR